MDTRFASFCKNADVLIHDAQYTPDEYPAHRGWGHSTWQDAVNAAKESNARRLLLAHHDPTRTDAELEAILEKARREFPRAELASQHLAIHPGE